MGNRPISDDIKETALALWNHGWTVEEICAVLKVSRRGCYLRWWQIFEEHGSVNRPPSPLTGRTLLLTRATLRALETLYADNTDLFLDEACTCQWLAAEHGITISTTALWRNLREAGLTRKILCKLAAERNEVTREEFEDTLQTHFIGDGSEFVVVDETSKNECIYARYYERAPHGQQPHITDAFAHGDQFSLYAALTIEGYLAACLVPGSYDAATGFYDFISEEVLPHMNPFPQPRSVLVLDECRIRHDPKLSELVESAGCLMLFLPPYSPDLTPIENSFTTLKAYIRRHGDQLRQIEDPIQSLLEATSCITPEKSRNWFKCAGYIVEEQ